MNTILKILNKEKPYIELLYLHNIGELKNILPELDALYTNEKGYKNNFLHTLEVLKNVCEYNNDYYMKIVALLHDIGKDKTKKLVNNKWIFYNHEKVGAKMAVDILKRWNIKDKDLLEYVYKMIYYHGRIKIHRDVSESAIRRLDNEIGKDIIFDLLDFGKLDLTTKYDYKKQKIISNLNTIKKRILEVRKKDEESKWRSPLTGHIIMDILNIGEGKIIGDIKKELDPLLKDNKISLEEAIEYIKKKWL